MRYEKRLTRPAMDIYMEVASRLLLSADAGSHRLAFRCMEWLTAIPDVGVQLVVDEDSDTGVFYVAHVTAEGIKTYQLPFSYTDCLPSIENWNGTIGSSDLDEYAWAARACDQNYALLGWLENIPFWHWPELLWGLRHFVYDEIPTNVFNCPFEQLSY